METVFQDVVDLLSSNSNVKACKLIKGSGYSFQYIIERLKSNNYSTFATTLTRVAKYHSFM